MEENSEKNQNTVSINPNETPILYTDNVFISINEDGVVLDVCQKMGPTNQLHVVARVGMSREHAKKLVKSLDALMLSSEAKKQVHTGESVSN